MEGKSINLVEAIFMVAMVIIVEIIEIVVTFFIGAGELAKWIINIIFWFPVRFWLKIKGVRNEYYTTAFFVEFIPFLNTLPIKSVVLAIVIHRHNKKIRENESDY